MTINKPEWFTLEEYKEYKRNRYSDKYIADRILFVSESVLRRFKVEIGWNFGEGKSLSGGHNKREVSIKQVKYLRSKGMNFKEICKYLNVGKSTLYRHLQNDDNYVSENEWMSVYRRLNRDRTLIRTVLQQLEEYIDKSDVKEGNEEAIKVLTKILK